MVEEVIGLEQMTTESKKYRPRLELFTATAKSFISNKAAVVGAVITFIYFAIAIIDTVAPSVFGIPSGEYTNLSYYSHHISPVETFGIFAPGTSHGFKYLLGGTIFNYPLLPAMFASLKFDLGYSVLIVGVGALVGSAIGVTAGYLGRWADEFMMRVTDVFFSVPFLILAIAFSTIFGHVMLSAVYALLIIWWPIYARLSRSLALSTKSLNYVEAATAAGSSKVRNIFYHVFPNVLSPIFVQISLDLGSIILIFATLSFLGVTNLPYSFPELGALISDGDNFVTSFIPLPGFHLIWWPLIIPGVFLLIFTVSINLFGDGLRDALDPKLRK